MKSKYKYHSNLGYYKKSNIFHDMIEYMLDNLRHKGIIFCNQRSSSFVWLLKTLEHRVITRPSCFIEKPQGPWVRCREGNTIFAEQKLCDLDNYPVSSGIQNT